MKTIEMKWIEDDNHVVAEDAYTGLKELIDTGVFNTLSCECKDDILYITGEKDELDKAVMKIQKAYAKYGQIMIKEAKKEGGLRIESFDDNVQEIFDYTVNEYNKLKENKSGADYITKLCDFQIKFKKLKEASKGKDKAILQGYLDEIADLSENYEERKIKPIRTKIVETVDPEDVDTVDDVIEAMQTIGYGPAVSRALVKDHLKDVLHLLMHGNSALETAKILDKQYMNEDVNNDLRKHLSNPANCGIIEEQMDRNTYNRKFNLVAKTYAEETGKNEEDVYDELMDNDELPELVDSELDIYEIVDKLLSESTINESLLSPAELKKKLSRVAAKWAYEIKTDYQTAYNELRKKKSVKDMLDFYTVDEIIDDLKKQRTEVDDELEEEI